MTELIWGEPRHGTASSRSVERQVPDSRPDWNEAVPSTGATVETIEWIAQALGITTELASRYFGFRDVALRAATLDRSRAECQLLARRIDDSVSLLTALVHSFEYTLAMRNAVEPIQDAIGSTGVAVDLAALVDEVLQDLMVPIYDRAQLRGQLRGDVPLAAVVEWLSAQHRLAFERGIAADLLPGWVARYVWPGVAPQFPA
jgi:hypothetical protein